MEKDLYETHLKYIPSYIPDKYALTIFAPKLKNLNKLKDFKNLKRLHLYFQKNIDNYPIPSTIIPVCINENLTELIISSCILPLNFDTKNIKILKLLNVDMNFNKFKNLDFLTIDYCSNYEDVDNINSLEFLNIQLDDNFIYKGKCLRLTNVDFNNFNASIYTNKLKIKSCCNVKHLYITSNYISIVDTELINFPIISFDCKILHLINNNIIKIPFIVCDLEELTLENDIADLYGLKYQNNLKIFKFNSNFAKLVPPVLRKFFKEKIIDRIVKDEQNVHESSIQKSIMDSIKNLLKNDQTLISDVITYDNTLTHDAKDIIKDKMKLTETYSIYGYTYADILKAVLIEIKLLSKTDNTNEMMKILNEEIIRSRDICLSGSIANIINSLNGISDKVTITALKNETISNIIIKNKDKGREYVIQELRKEGYTEDLSEWIDELEY